MKSFFMGSLLLIALSISVTPTFAQTSGVKLGFVDRDVIVQQLPEFKDIETRLKSAQKVYEDSLKAMQAEFQEKADAYQKQQGLMNAETKAQEETKLNAIRDRFLQYQQAKLGQQGEYAQLQQQLLMPVNEKVRAAIEKVAKDEKLSAVMETGMMVYYDKKLDITFNVLAYLRRADNK